MVITYIKETGEIVSPIQTSEKALTMEDLFEEKAVIMSKVYDVVNIVDNMNVFNMIFNYYVDVETKELKLKEETRILKMEVD
ncbi:hypothetical protein [Clostridium saudiense]|uniref:hypothetical protein n=1 Tax=Clostridium saudiense TaxID=1414720 RepID=UPI0018ABE436|nr:hypothetical protein [Clostridium saudiense]